MKSNLMTAIVFAACGLSLISSCTMDGRLRNLSYETRSVEISQQEFLLRPGDQLTLFYSIKAVSDTASYTLEPGDQIRIVVAEREDVSRLYTIAPDGLLYLPAAKPIAAAGRTASDIEAAIQKALKPVTVSASIFVSFERFNSLSLSLINSLSPLNSQGPYFRTVVDQDSSIFLPRIGRVVCAGKPLKKVIAEIERLYQATYSALQIIPVFDNSGMNTITVLGEVGRPGAFAASGRITLSTALGLAGGWMKSAAMQSIIVVQRDGQKIEVRRINFKRDIITASQLPLAAGDIVFVPAKPITDIDVFVDEYIRKLLPISVGASLYIPNL